MPVGSRGIPPNYFGQVFLFAWLSLARLIRPPSHSRRAQAARRWARHSLWLTAVGAFVIAALMFLLDAREIAWMPARGAGNLWLVRILTDFGKAAYVLEALAAIMLLVLIIAAALRRARRLPSIAFGTRIQFVFLAVLVPILAGEAIKGIVGRGRPFVGGQANAFNFSHFAWKETYASFPSGHAITSFALAFAVAAVWPHLRIAMAIYALAIAVSRLVLLAHHPSDVVAGALLGVVGAMLVRYWFAARHLVFTIRPDGSIEPLAGPSWERIKALLASRSFRAARTQRTLRPSSVSDHTSNEP